MNNYVDSNGRGRGVMGKLSKNFDHFVHTGALVIDRWMDFSYEEGINDGKFIVVGILTYYFCVADQLGGQ